MKGTPYPSDCDDQSKGLFEMVEQVGMVEKIVSMDVIEYGGEPVVTLRMVDDLHERPDGTAGRNFRRHRGRLQEGVDFFEVNGVDEIRRACPEAAGAESLILLTESGYLMLVKSFRDDLAWEVQRTLVNHYFRSKSLSPDRRVMREISCEIAKGIRDGLHDGLKPVNNRLERVEVGLEEVRDQLRSVVRRKNLTAATRRQHIDTLMWLGGKCPCCERREVIDEYGNKLDSSDWEHFYAPHRASATETWLVCRQCNRDLKDHQKRNEREAFFKAYQLRREEKHTPLLKPFDTT